MAGDKFSVGVVGCGYWGPNYVRVLHDLNRVGQVWCCDAREERTEKLRKRFPAIRTWKTWQEMVRDPGLDAVVVSTPASSHYGIIKESLLAGKDVLAEKPLTLDPAECLELHELAERNGRILMVAHTFLYNAGVRKMKEMIDSGEAGRIYYINATRTHLGLLRDDVNVVWDLAPHDISIFNYLLGAVPVRVDGIGACHLKTGREDVAFINLVYPGNVLANIHVSWEDSNKERTVRLVGSKARIVFDDIDNLERVKVFKKGIAVSEEYNNFGEFQLNLRDGDIVSPKCEMAEPLTVMCSHFLDCVATRGKPLTDGRSGYEVVKVVSEFLQVLRGSSARGVAG
jgi:predicted dehydrogenase